MRHMIHIFQLIAITHNLWIACNGFINTCKYACYMWIVFDSLNHKENENITLSLIIICFFVGANYERWECGSGSGCKVDSQSWLLPTFCSKPLVIFWWMNKPLSLLLQPVNLLLIKPKIVLAVMLKAFVFLHWLKTLLHLSSLMYPMYSLFNAMENKYYITFGEEKINKRKRSTIRMI